LHNDKELAMNDVVTARPLSETATWHGARSPPEAWISALVLLCTLVWRCLRCGWRRQNPSSRRSTRLMRVFATSAWVQGGQLKYLMGTDVARDMVSVMFQPVRFASGVLCPNRFVADCCMPGLPLRSRRWTD
jgi:ABC-type antimicrobial peptide transport system permease subunit